jgi:polyisoprenoid-binding protein YceI
VALDVSPEGRVTDPSGNERSGFSARTKIDRTDFGLTWNQALEAGGVLVGDEVRISAEVELVRQSEQAAV